MKVSMRDSLLGWELTNVGTGVTPSPYNGSYANLHH